MKIVVSDILEEEALEKLRTIGEVLYRPERLEETLVDADVLIVRSATTVTKELINAGKKLKVVARAGVGLDNIDVEHCKKKGIVVINTPGASANAVAELTIGSIINTLRRYRVHIMK